ncbi:glycoside hydrolase 15-related [Caballeronia hypogeia]|uniref:Glycoside hydrolase 15-related n=1 Tax=Caballeronia hypogeia TaxID=1777140 RepID=A0A158AFF0_9BURK|nr:glycoside hydrolase family 15 protein [Caballeronia hypogeia]SAK55777.1 glycoside hydrolase 15-related [Caballeronia hypogeia]
MAPRIEDHALLGDGRASALVTTDGSIDWLCWPMFESAPCFAALLGDASNGHWRIAPVEPVRSVTRRYLDSSLVLQTTMHTASGSVEITDCLAWGETPARLVRRVHCVSGRVTMASEFAIRFDHGRTRPWLRPFGKRIAAIGGAHALWFDTPSEPVLDADAVRHEITLAEGECCDFALTCCRSWDAPPAAPDVRALLDATLHHWAQWSARLELKDQRYIEPIRRSLAVLRGLTHRLTGGIAAAATSSLPERIGGDLNWDYRYCWLRDASFTMLALAGTGMRGEAQAWRDWLLRALAGDPVHTQTIYTTEGDSHIAEWSCDWLRGYESSRPVRFGNAAVTQSQHDIYGEIIDALYVSRCHGMPPDDDIWKLEHDLIEHVRRIWRQPDNGVWESRGGARHHTLSKVMAWLALDRGIKCAERFGHDAPVDEWRHDADVIRHSVMTHGFHRGVNAFTQCYDSDRLDASLLLLPLRGFLPADDLRMIATVDAIERRLMHDGLVFRFLDQHDARPEGAFIACCCWLAQVRQMQGRETQARTLFERVLSIQNDLGLLAEEYDTEKKRQCGNYPQVLSHVALINAACYFDDTDHSLHAL